MDEVWVETLHGFPKDLPIMPRERLPRWLEVSDLVSAGRSFSSKPCEELDFCPHLHEGFRQFTGNPARTARCLWKQHIADRKNFHRIEEIVVLIYPTYCEDYRTIVIDHLWPNTQSRIKV